MSYVVIVAVFILVLFTKDHLLSTQFKIDSQSKKNVGIWNELLGFKSF